MLSQLWLEKVKSITLTTTIMQRSMLHKQECVKYIVKNRKSLGIWHRMRIIGFLGESPVRMVSQEPPRLSQFVKFVKFVVVEINPWNRLNLWFYYLRVFLFKTDTGVFRVSRFLCFIIYLNVSREPCAACITSHNCWGVSPIQVSVSHPYRCRYLTHTGVGVSPIHPTVSHS